MYILELLMHCFNDKYHYKNIVDQDFLLQFSKDLCREKPGLARACSDEGALSNYINFNGFTDQTDLSKLPEAKKNQYVLFRPTFEVDWSTFKGTYNVLHVKNPHDKWLTVKIPEDELPFWMSKRFYYVMVFTTLTLPYMMFVHCRCTVVTFKFYKTIY